MVELPASPRLHLAAPTEVSRAMASPCAGACAPGARRFETVGSTWLACRCFGDAGGYTLRTLAAGWHSNAVDCAFRLWFLTRSIDRRCDVSLHTRAVLRGRGESHRFRHNKTRSRRSVQILVSTNQGAIPCFQERWSQPCRTCG